MKPELRRVWATNYCEGQLYEGNSFELLNQLEANSIDCIWTDPPYFLSGGGPTCVGGERVTVNKGNWDKERTWEEIHKFNVDWLHCCHRVLKLTGTIWVSGTYHNYPSVAFALRQLGFRILNDIIWEKPAPPPNLGCRCFTHASEILFWATKAPRNDAHKYTFNYERMKELNGGKQMKNLWRIGKPRFEETVYGKHPTQKPVALVERCLLASTNPGDVVLDPFVGSGTTGVAALHNDRQFIGCENERTYIEIAAERLDEVYQTKQRKGILA